MKKIIQFIFLTFPILLTAQGMIVNEISNGTSGTKEFMEFVVIGSASAPSAPVDLSGWIIDDNNGDFEGLVSGVGIATGHLRIAPGCLTAVMPGSIILIYNDADLNTAIPVGASDPTDANSDCIYILNATDPCIEACTNTPFFASAASNSSAYTPCTSGAASWNQVGMANAQDVGQVRMPGGAFFHGFSYGLNAPFPTFPAALGGGSAFNVTGSGSGGTFFFNSGSFTASTNFARGAAGTAAETPGAANNDANRYFINALRAGTYDYANLNNPINTGTAPALSPCPTTLPVYLSAFDAEKQGNSVQLTWVLESATSDFFDFEIERSFDGIEFVAIGQLQGKRSISYYESFDDAPLSNNYYRLKMVDENAGFRYSQVRYVHFDVPTETICIYPNPLKGDRILNIDTDKPVNKVLIYNSLGQLILEKSTLMTNRLELPIEWPGGMYSVLLNVEGNQLVRKLVLEQY